MAYHFIKKETLEQVISCEFCKIFKITFFMEAIWETASVNANSLCCYNIAQKNTKVLRNLFY